MVYYYDRETNRRMFEFQAFDFTYFRLALHVLTTPVLTWRAGVCGSSLAPDDFPDITVIRPGGPMRSNIIVSDTPQPPKGKTLRLLSNPSTMDIPSHVKLPPPPKYEPWY